MASEKLYRNTFNDAYFPSFAFKLFKLVNNNFSMDRSFHRCFILEILTTPEDLHTQINLPD